MSEKVFAAGMRDPLSRKVIGCAIEVHRELGPGLLESAYQECLCHELALNGLKFKKEVWLPVVYKGIKIDCQYRLDIVVEKSLIVEVKAVEEISGLHEAQLLTYLKMSGMQKGLLLNFNVPFMRDGIKRMVRTKPQP